MNRQKWAATLLPWVGVRNARLRLREVRAEGERLHRHLDAVHAEIQLNDWTRTAKRIFSGRD